MAALQDGFNNAHVQLQLDDSRMHFPYYGNTLEGLVDKAETVASVVVKGGKDTIGDAEASLMSQVFREVLDAKGISQADVSAAQAAAGMTVIKKGPLDWGWVLTGLRMLNGLGFGTLALELCTRDVYQYVYDPSVAQDINDGVSAPFPIRKRL